MEDPLVLEVAKRNLDQISFWIDGVRSIDVFCILCENTFIAPITVLEIWGSDDLCGDTRDESGTNINFQTLCPHCNNNTMGNLGWIKPKIRKILPIGNNARR